jgi:ATP-dependent protease ClpP protease subunit
MPAKAPRWFHITNNAAAKKAEIKLRGYIGASQEGDPWWGIEGGAGTFKEFEAAVEALGDVHDVTLRIFSEGGDVHVGMGIHDLIKTHPARWTCIIDGICASAATYAAVACAEVHIPANAYFMIHNAQGGAYGEADEVQAMATLLESINNNIADLYAGKCGKSVEEIRTVMAASTWMNGREAVEFGLADKVLHEVTVPVTNKVNFAAMTIINRAATATMPADAAVWFDKRAAATPRNQPTHMPNVSTTTAAPASSAAPGSQGAPVNPPAPGAAPANTTTTTTTPPGNGGGQGGEPAPKQNKKLTNAEKRVQDLQAKLRKAKNSVKKLKNEVDEDEDDEDLENAEDDDEDDEDDDEGATNLTKTITKAVNAAVKPLKEEVENLKNLRTQNVPANAWGNGQPTQAAAGNQQEQQQKPDLANLSPMQLIGLGMKNAMTKAATPPATT